MVIIRQVDKMLRTKRTLIIFITIFLTLAITAISLIYYKKDNTSPTDKIVLNFEAVPKDTSMKVNGATYNMSDKAILDPGFYEISFERYGFKNQTIKLNLTRNRTLFIAMAPVSNEAKQWEQENKDLYQKMSGKQQLAASESAEQTGIDYPLLHKLPITSGDYRIGFYDNTAGEKVIVVYSPPNLLPIVIDYLKSFGYDLSKYVFEYVDGTDINNRQADRTLNPFIAEKGDL